MTPSLHDLPCKKQLQLQRFSGHEKHDAQLKLIGHSKEVERYDVKHVIEQ